MRGCDCGGYGEKLGIQEEGVVCVWMEDFLTYDT